MVRLLFILLFIFNSNLIISQSDSATIILKNTSHNIFTKYIVVIQGQLLGGEKLKPNESSSYRIKISDNKIYRFCIYIDKKTENKYSIEPFDYYNQVSELKIEKGEYTYFINVIKKEEE